MNTLYNILVRPFRCSAWADLADLFTPEPNAPEPRPARITIISTTPEGTPPLAA